ncbi:MAG: MutS family DNA mismatch repair protein, partial [Pirellulaceae bacterium]|nr:MutS family DNA mismatch repair protein [Pirellulaceae bacterium]
NLRQDAILGIPYLLAQLVFLIDVHLLHLVELWQQRHGHLVRAWLESVGELEAISSLAMLAHDNPTWTLPNFKDSPEPSVTATELGHALLSNDVCVRNDVKLGPTGTFLLVTGSNMSGKSTLLRSIGVNVALAQAGGPVCAAEFQLTPLRIATSMRITDSLEDGISFFMAELKRLKQIVDQSGEASQEDEATLLYLLDEILQGTNSSERHIAVSRVIRHLVENGAIGAVSTHDLGLAKNPDLVDVCETVHFRESFSSGENGQKMTFDYKVRSGVSPTTNALKLLELVGLND